VQAKDTVGGTVQNYQGAYAKPVTLSDALHAAAFGSFAPAPIPNTMFNMGLAAFDATSVISVTYTFNNIATGPTTVMVRAVEAAGGDGVSSATPAAPTEGLLNIRSGRLWLGNAYGSEMLNLPVPLQAQYFDGSNFVINPADDVANTCTTVVLPTLTLLPSGTPVGATLNSSLLAGNGGLVLTAPHVAGTVGMTFVAPAWLQYNWTGAGVGNPSARATFGVFGGGSNDVFIYRGRRGR
jgi:MSHA biogenesis protein MshQ